MYAYGNKHLVFFFFWIDKLGIDKFCGSFNED